MIKPATDLKVKIEPDIKKLNISEGPQKIKLSVINKDNLKFNWHLKGPGKLIGDASASDIIYEVPLTLNSEEAEVQIILTAATDQKQNDIPPYPIRFKLRNLNYAPEVTETDKPAKNSDEISRLKKNFEKLRTVGIGRQEQIAKITKIAGQCYKNYVYETFQPTPVRSSELPYYIPDDLNGWYYMDKLSSSSEC
ncbi:hypothetical protein QUF75_17745 [Desulfococcaceae bacterium HSG7]|nr:hypothetical protein [Desulfococcaceae bacterium HSG7]